MIIHAKPVPYSEPRCYSDWHFRGSFGAPIKDKPKEEEKEFIKEEEFKV